MVPKEGLEPPLPLRELRSKRSASAIPPFGLVPLDGLAPSFPGYKSGASLSMLEGLSSLFMLQSNFQCQIFDSYHYHIYLPLRQLEEQYSNLAFQGYV